MVNRELKRIVKALLSEFKLPQSQWNSLIPIVQSAMNNRPRARLGNKAPIIVFTGLPRQSSLGCLKTTIQDQIHLKQVDDIEKIQLDCISSLSSAMDGMHKAAKEKSDKERKRKVEAFNQKTGTRLVNFDVGDYVLRGLLKRESPKKLNLNWVGPMRVTRCLSEFLFEVQYILTGKLKVVHGSRLRFFRKENFNITEDVDKFLNYQQGEYASIKAFVDLREHRRK